MVLVQHDRPVGISIITQDPFELNRRLRQLVDRSDLTLTELLARFNRGQARPLALRTLKTYLASAQARTRVPCPKRVLDRIESVLGHGGTGSIVTSVPEDH